MATVPSANSNFRPLLTSGTGATADDRKDEIRRAYFSEAGGYVDCLIVRREALRPGETISGPVIIEDKESTTVVPPGDTVSIGETRDLIVSIQTEPNQ